MSRRRAHRDAERPKFWRQPWAFVALRLGIAIAGYAVFVGFVDIAGTNDATVIADPEAVQTSSALIAIDESPVGLSGSTRPGPPSPLNVDLALHSPRDTTSLWVVVNKRFALDPIDYVPELANVQGNQVDARTVDDLQALLAAARDAGNPLRIVSAYRSYQLQDRLFNTSVEGRGQSEAEHWLARPGHSEHQTGLAVDFGVSGSVACDLQECFGDMDAGRWLAEHAHEYGYILRYNGDNQEITGYGYEPWHFRYVGVELATAMHLSGISTLEEVFRMPGGDYED